MILTTVHTTRRGKWSRQRDERLQIQNKMHIEMPVLHMHHYYPTMHCTIRCSEMYRLPSRTQHSLAGCHAAGRTHSPNVAARPRQGCCECWPPCSPQRHCQDHATGSRAEPAAAPSAPHQHLHPLDAPSRAAALADGTRAPGRRRHHPSTGHTSMVRRVRHHMHQPPHRMRRQGCSHAAVDGSLHGGLATEP